TLGAIFGRDLMAPDALAERLAHMTEVVLGYVRPLPSIARKTRATGTARAASSARTRRPA
ncbi:MAG TPA: hypothetical protein VFF43_06295, partial [Caldimonas sp.]|nr:hypothetical protein [Caldimonas sp.]